LNAVFGQNNWIVLVLIGVAKLLRLGLLQPR